jgi:hypothetical protein
MIDFSTDMSNTQRLEILKSASPLGATRRFERLATRATRASANPVGVASANGSCAVPCQWLPQAGIVTLAACHRDGHPGRRLGVASDGPGLAGLSLRASVGSESTIDVKAVRRFAD